MMIVSVSYEQYISRGFVNFVIEVDFTVNSTKFYTSSPTKTVNQNGKVFFKME